MRQAQKTMDYTTLCSTYGQLEAAGRRLEKARILADFLKRVPEDELEAVLLLLQGIAYPRWDRRKLGFSSSLLLKALSRAAGVPVAAIEDSWRETGDLGESARVLLSGKRQATLFSRRLTLAKVFLNLRRLAEQEGAGSVEGKVQLVAELLASAAPEEAKFVVRTVLDELRVGLGEGTLRDALVWAFLPAVIGISAEHAVPLPEGTLSVRSFGEFRERRKEGHAFIFSEDGAVARAIYSWQVSRVQRALDLCNDFALVARKLKEGGIAGFRSITLVPGTPLKVMLALKEDGIAAAFERVGRPAALEYKLDGFRMQVHRSGERITIFTRRLEDVTAQFPDVVAAVRAQIAGERFILDGEAVGIDPAAGRFLPFQAISQRIRRKYEVTETAKKFPVELHVFDVLFHDGTGMLRRPFAERRAVLERLVRSGGIVKLIAQLQTDDEQEAAQFYRQSLARGNEGIMLKKLGAPYRPGARVGYLVKLKSTMETLDLVIVGAEWGEGKRGSWLSSYALACRDEPSGELKTLGRVSTGLKEKREEGLSFAEMTDLLRPLIAGQKGREVVVKPQLVMEVSYEEIQKSPSYGSGFALRFPRVVRLRADRDAASCSTLADVQRLYGQQRERSG